MTIPMAGIIAVTWFEPWHVRFQTCHQRSCPATLDRFRQEAPRVGAGQLSARVGLILACQELSIGQQRIDFAIAKDPLGRNRSTIERCACEGPLVQRTQRLDIITRASGAQCKLPCQSLRIGESWAGVLVVVVSLVVVRMGIASLAIHGRCDFRVRRAGDGMDQVLSGRRCSECRRRSSHDDNADNRSRYKLSS